MTDLLHSFVFMALLVNMASECLDADSECIIDLLCDLEQVTILPSVSSTVEYKWQWCRPQRAEDGTRKYE